MQAVGGGPEHGQQHGAGGQQHGGAQVGAEWSDTDGVVTFAPWGRCRLTVGEANLTVRIEAGDEPGLLRIRDVVTADLERFGHREPLTIRWSPGPA